MKNLGIKAIDVYTKKVERKARLSERRKVIRILRKMKCQ